MDAADASRYNRPIMKPISAHPNFARTVLRLALRLSLGWLGLQAASVAEVRQADLAYPMVLMVTAEDAEDEPGPTGLRDVYTGTEGCQLSFGEVRRTEGQGLLARVVTASWPGDEARAPVEAVAPEGGWLVDAAWTDPRSELFMLMQLSEAGRTAVFLDCEQFRELARVPVQATPPGTEGWSMATIPLAIENERLFFRSGPPDAVARYFPREAALQPGERWWREAAHEEEQLAVERWHSHLEAARQALGQADGEWTDKQALAVVDEVLRAELLPIPPAGELTGAWRVRSIQGGLTGVFIYPFFKAKIEATGQGRELRFAKLTGSQRRSGRLLPAADERALVFLGGSTVNENPQVGYSRLDDTVDAPRRDSDTGGVFIRLSRDRYAMVLDAASPESFEIYDLRR